MELFLTFVRKQKDAYGFSDCTIGNMDEVPMSFDAPDNRAFDSKVFKTVNIVTAEHEKTSFYCCAGMHGQWGESSPHGDIQEKNYATEKITPKVEVSMNEKGWMNEQEMGKLIEVCCTRRPEAIFVPSHCSLSWLWTL